MRTNEFKRKPLTEWVAYSLATAAVVGSTLVYAASPAAGTEIKNLATVTYEDSEGNKYSAQSNEAIITVAPQYKANIEGDNAINVAPGQTAYLPHTITNTGNVADTFDVAADMGAKVYLDTNGNGQPDAGEVEVTQVTLNAGEVANIVVAYPVAVTASNGDTEKVTLTATSTNGGALTDTGANADGTDTTLENNLTVTTDAVIVSTKSATVDEANNQITYTLTVKNVGGTAEDNVVILDALPSVDTDGDGTVDTQVTLVGTPVLNGFLEANDTAAADAATTEATLSFDVDGADGINGAGATDSNVIRVLDASLPPNTTVSVQFTVSYDPTWEAGAMIENSFVAYPNPNTTDPTNVIDPPPTTGVGVPNPSNKTTTEIPTTHGITVSDTGTADPDNDAGTANDGGDDDATVDDTQSIDSASSGEELKYLIDITNDGNGSDIFNLTAANNTFPAGSVITFWSPDGTVQLTDTDSDGITDTGVIPSGDTQQIMVKVDLPSGVQSATAVDATVTATSSGDPSLTNDVTIEVGSINPPAVDVAAQAAGDQTHAGYQDDGTENAHDESPVALFGVVPGEVVSIPLKVANESGSSESYILAYENLPADWSVVFKDAGGAVITSTPFIPGGDEFMYTAEVTVSADPTKALADAPVMGDNFDGYDNVNDAAATQSGNDGDLDYVISFKTTSASNPGITDNAKFSFDVTPSDQEVTLSPNGQNQIAPGGTVDYKHKLENSGNTDKEVELAVDNNQTGWNSVILVDTDGDGVPETNYADLNPGDTVHVTNPDGSTTPVNVTDADTDGKVEIPLQPGQYVNVVNKTFAPTDAAQGVVNTTTLTATNPDDTVVASVEANSSVILGQVRLSKTVALDADCNGQADGAFAEIQAAQVEPGQCATWKLTAKNEGNAAVENVVITDNVPEFTSYLDTSLVYCQGVSCIDTAAMPDLPGTPVALPANVIVAGDNIAANVGTGANATQGGQLIPGDEATIMFTIQID